MKIRPNLVEILNRLSAFNYAYIWIDAICTNQSDLTECSAQVLRMRSIYAGAREVIVATETGTSSYADKIAQILCLVEPTLSPENQATQITDMLSDNSIRTALEILCNDDYWSRIWIVQEFAIGHNVKFLFKNSVIAAGNLEVLLHILAKRWANKIWNSVRVIYSIRKSWQTNKPIQLLEMLGQTQNSMCKRRHDRVFGLLGLCPDALKYIFEPSYGMDIATLTTSMTQSYIARISLDIIFLAPYYRHDSKQPSWCTDFFQFDQNPPIERVLEMIIREKENDLRIGRQTRWHATGSVTSSVIFQENILRTPAFHIGTIRSLGTAQSDESNSNFPAHDPAWSRTFDALAVCQSMRWVFTEPGALSPLQAVYGYSFVRAFLRSHGTQDVEDLRGGLANWICRNRSFFTGTQTLEDSAKSLKHPFLIHGIHAFFEEYYDRKCNAELWDRMDRMSKTDMRLMCLDDSHNFGIGWAATPARLYDKVFLIPGCSSPVILRPKRKGGYEVVGDAIVLGAMKNEIWSKVKAEELEHIEIV